MMRLDPALSDEGPNGEESVTTVDLEKAMRQESRQLELPLEDRGEAPKVEGSGEAGTVAHGDERSGSEHLLMEEVVGRANLVGALKRVRQNKGSPGIDGMSVEELPEYLRRHWGRSDSGCWRGPTNRSRYEGRRYRRVGEGSGSWGFRPCWTGSSNKPSCRCCNRDSTRRSVGTATASGLGAEHTMRCAKRSNTSRKGDDGWWMWTWRSFSTGEPRRADGAAGKADRG